MPRASRTSRPPGRPSSLLANVPAVIALQRAYLAELRGDAEDAAVLVSRALADIGKGETMLQFVEGTWPSRLAQWEADRRLLGVLMKHR